MIGSSSLQISSLPSQYPAADSAHSFWTSLRYFNAYRIAIASLFVLSATRFGEALDFGRQAPRLFLVVSVVYLILAVCFQGFMWRFPRRFNVQLSVHVFTDVIATTLLMYASGGFRSGLAVMLLISLAAAALVSRGKQMLFYAAVATIAVLIEQAVWVLGTDQSAASFLPPGLISIGYFATALITNQLARRVISNEAVARQRGVDLANQLRVNQLMIQNVQDGVLVVDAEGRVRQHNGHAEGLMGNAAPEGARIEAYSPELARALDAWRRGDGAEINTLAALRSGRVVQARFVGVGAEGGNATVVYLEDQSKLEEQAQQLKLAALGRLTANIAHEIRNPLSAIVHAADLMQEENRAPSRERLTRIIRDNARRLDRMVKDVLELNRRDRVQAEPVRLVSFLESFIDEFAQSEEVPLEGFVLDASQEAVVDFDRVHLHQILWNLVRNAWRHSRKSNGSVVLRLLRQGNRLELHVVDDGPGVSKALQSQLFEPFFTTFSSGTGLGLYIARELCAANGSALEYVDGASGADFCIAWQGMRE